MIIVIAAAIGEASMPAAVAFEPLGMMRIALRFQFQGGLRPHQHGIIELLETRQAFKSSSSNRRELELYFNQ